MAYRKDYETRPLVERDMGDISIHSLDKSKVVSRFIDDIKNGIEACFDNFQIDMGCFELCVE